MVGARPHAVGAQAAGGKRRTEFCRSLDRTVSLMERGTSAFPLPDGSPAPKYAPDLERRSTVPGFSKAEVTESKTLVRVRLLGPSSGDTGKQFVMMNDILQAVKGCYPEVETVAESNLRQDEPGFTSVLGPGEPLFAVTGTKGGQVVLTVLAWKPGQYVEVVGKRRSEDLKYTALGCEVGDDVCVTRRTVNR